MAETILLEIPRFRDADGNPTCAADFRLGQVCPFFGTQKFGQHETCWFGTKTSEMWEPLWRRDAPLSSLIPLAKCPVWVER